MLALALIFALAAGVFSLHSTPAGIPYSEVLDQFRNEKVSSFTLEGSTLTLRLRGENGAEKSGKHEKPDNQRDDSKNFCDNLII